MSDVIKTAFGEGVPDLERYEATAALTKAAMPSQSDLIPASNILQFADFVRDGHAEGLVKARVIELPYENRGKDKGMQSVWLDRMSVIPQGEYFDKPSIMNFDMLRAMVESTPILNAIVLTRIRQVLRYCNPQERDDGNPGFAIVHLDPKHQATKSEQESMRLLTRFVANCGWEFNPRSRKRLRRDNFSGMMTKLVRDSLTLDAAAIETEFKRDRRQGIDGLYAVDGATIRLCDDTGYDGDDQVFALQVLQSRVVTAYTHNDLIYEPRNPRTDVRLAGYGLSETELLVRVVTGFLNAFTMNIDGFDKNSIPRGLLQLFGDYDAGDLAAFKRYWNAMVQGAHNRWSMPVMTAKDKESGANWVPFNVDHNEMYFAKWMTFLASIACAIYGMSPAEINFDSFTGGSTSALAGSDTAEKIAHSEDKGLRPLLAYFEGTWSDFVIAEFSDKYGFRWTGLDPEDPEKLHEKKKLVLTVNEMRAELNYQKADGDWGDAPLNPSLVGAWQQEQQAGQEDYGQMDGEEPPAGQNEGDDPGKGKPFEQKAPGEKPDMTEPQDKAGDMAKAFRVYGIE